MKKWLETDSFEEAFDKFNDNVDEIEQGFDNRYTKQEVDTSLDLKANKQQEEWITPTLLGGATGTVVYLKDEFGFVHFRGRVNNAGGLLTLFVMPTGYRPKINSDFIVFSSGHAKRVRINNSGDVDNSDSQSFVDFSNIIYRAEM